MINNAKGKDIFQGIIMPLTAMLLWGSLFPCIKLGYRAFNIDTTCVGDILMFASMRFLVCGVIVCAIAFFSKATIALPKKQSVLNICLMGVFAIVLHYGFSYVGLSLTDSSKTALLKQIAPLLYACFSFLFIKEEKFSKTKLIGAFAGFCGIIAINSGASGGFSFSIGDALILAASLCTVVSTIISGRSVKGTSPFWITGISQLFGGAVLFVISLAFGGSIPVFAPASIPVFAYICFASISGYTLFYYSQRSSQLSKLFIIKFSEPLFACVFSAILLKEDIFKLQYLLAFILISFGIVLGNMKKSKPQ